jgi:hypothetical protein
MLIVDCSKVSACIEDKAKRRLTKGRLLWQYSIIHACYLGLQDAYRKVNTRRMMAEEDRDQLHKLVKETRKVVMAGMGTPELWKLYKMPLFLSTIKE